jgi:alkylated DNA repair protein (DNA oxidative demethylase)
MHQPSLLDFDTSPEEIAAGAFHLRGYLSREEQRELAALCLEAGRRPAGFYTPVHFSGHPLRIRYFCFGWHWSPQTYTYSRTRTDADGLPVQPMPAELVALGRRLAAEVGMAIEPDIVLVNHYGAEGRLGLHQDKDESPETLARGVPVVSISLGDTAEFVFGGHTRAEPKRVIPLRSGDAFVFGGASRMRFHGVKGILPGTGPGWLGFEGRINLTIRESGLKALREPSLPPGGGSPGP